MVFQEQVGHPRWGRLQGRRGPDDQGHHPRGRAHLRARRRSDRPVRQQEDRRRAHRNDQAQRLGPDLERAPGHRRVARERQRDDRDRSSGCREARGGGAGSGRGVQGVRLGCSSQESRSPDLSQIGAFPRSVASPKKTTEFASRVFSRAPTRVAPGTIGSKSGGRATGGGADPGPSSHCGTSRQSGAVRWSSPRPGTRHGDSAVQPSGPRLPSRSEVRR